LREVEAPTFSDIRLTDGSKVYVIFIIPINNFTAVRYAGRNRRLINLKIKVILVFNYVIKHYAAKEYEGVEV
jgi:hypothetical protein